MYAESIPWVKTCVSWDINTICNKMWEYFQIPETQYSDWICSAARDLEEL